MILIQHLGHCTPVHYKRWMTLMDLCCQIQHVEARHLYCSLLVISMCWTALCRIHNTHGQDYQMTRLRLMTISRLHLHLKRLGYQMCLMTFDYQIPLQRPLEASTCLGDFLVAPQILCLNQRHNILKITYVMSVLVLFQQRVTLPPTVELKPPPLLLLPANKSRVSEVESTITAHLRTPIS
jgi:hypothetical protein